MSFNVSCTPGRDAAAGFIQVSEDLPTLVIYLDPVNLAIQVPSVPGGEALLARFCRELAYEASKLADAVDPADKPNWPTGEKPRHARHDGGATGYA